MTDSDVPLGGEPDAIADRIVARLDALIDEAAKIPPGSASYTDVLGRPRSVTDVSNGQFSKWRSQAFVFLTNVFGDNHDYPAFFINSTTQPSEANVANGVAILTAAGEDVAGGWLKPLLSQLTSRVFADLLEMARHFHDEGWNLAAVSVAGAVLESGLRKRAGQDDLTGWNLQSLNDQLVNREVYSRADWSQVKIWTRFRDMAVHGENEQFEAEASPTAIANLLSGVGDLVERLA